MTHFLKLLQKCSFFNILDKFVSQKNVYVYPPFWEVFQPSTFWFIGPPCVLLEKVIWLSRATFIEILSRDIIV